LRRGARSCAGRLGPRFASGRVALLLVCLAGACGDESEEDHGLISGTVRDESTGERLKGVKVTFTSDTLEAQEDRTNSEGKYSIFVTTRTPNGRIQASKQGYQRKVVSAFVDSNDVQIDVALRPQE
jgi:hypothetical protein